MQSVISDRHGCQFKYLVVEREFLREEKTKAEDGEEVNSRRWKRKKTIGQSSQ